VKGTICVGEAKSTKASSVASAALPERRQKPRHDNVHDIGGALRAAYDSAVNEEIPPEMLDLLSKLR
jgi:Anti-sigma factor NepR